MMEKRIQAYPEEMLKACRKGTPCEYGICDECPIIVGNKGDDDDNEET